MLAAAACLCLLVVPARAVTTNWNTNLSGSFTKTANWDNGVPDSDDTAVFNRGFVAYTVTVPGLPFNPPPNYVIDYLRVNTNEVTFADSPLTNRPSLTIVNPGFSIVIGENIGDVAILNSTLRSVSGANTSIGLRRRRRGHAQRQLRNVRHEWRHVCGRFRRGHPNRSKRRHAHNAVRHRDRRPCQRRWHGDCQRRRLLLERRRRVVGYFGTGTLTIESGGSISGPFGHIAFESGSNGMVTVTGTGSTWTNDQLFVGKEGTGTLVIESGGSVTTSTASFVGSTAQVLLEP